MESDEHSGRRETPPPLPKTGRSGRENYRLFSDTVVGVNTRWRDNVIQAVVVLFFAAAGAAICGWIGREQGYFKQGLLLGTLAGLVSGVLVTGIFIMVYRGLRHLMGKHD